jgi:hypothetical protein
VNIISKSRLQSESHVDVSQHFQRPLRADASISSRLAALANRVASASSAAPSGLLVEQPVRPLPAPTTTDWTVATPLDKPMAVAPRRRMVTWEEVTRDVQARCQFAPSAAVDPVVQDAAPVPVGVASPEHGRQADVAPAEPSPLDASPPAELGSQAAPELPQRGATPVAQPRKAMSAKERMAKRRAELRRLGLSASYKGSLKALSVASVTTTTSPVVTFAPPEPTPLVTDTAPSLSSVTTPPPEPALSSPPSVTCSGMEAGNDD